MVHSHARPGSASLWSETGGPFPHPALWVPFFRTRSPCFGPTLFLWSHPFPFPLFLSVSATPEQPGVSRALLTSPGRLHFALDFGLQLNCISAVSIRGTTVPFCPEKPSLSPRLLVAPMVLTWETCVTNDLDESEILFSSTYLQSA